MPIKKRKVCLDVSVLCLIPDIGCENSDRDKIAIGRKKSWAVWERSLSRRQNAVRSGKRFSDVQRRQAKYTQTGNAFRSGRFASEIEKYAQKLVYGRAH